MNAMLITMRSKRYEQVVVVCGGVEEKGSSIGNGWSHPFPLAGWKLAMWLEMK